MERGQVIDIHCHTAGIGAGGSGCFLSERLRNNIRYGLYLKGFDVQEADVVAQGDGLVVRRLAERLAESQYVGRAVVLALDGIVGADGDLDRAATEVYLPNEFVAAEVRRHPNLLFGASINPYRRDAIQRLERAAADGAVLVKWIPSVMRINPDDPQLLPFYLKMKELGLPLLCHTGTERSFTFAENPRSDPVRLRFPLGLGVTVIAAHAAAAGANEGRSNFERLLPMFAEYPNLYADVSALTLIHLLGRLRDVVRRPELRGRLVFGTDMPLPETFLSSPLYSVPDLTARQMWALLHTPNPWDRDVLWKRAMGLPPEVFAKTAEVIRLPGRREVCLCRSRR